MNRPQEAKEECYTEANKKSKVEVSDWHPNSAFLCLNKVWSSTQNLRQENNAEAGQSETEQKPRLRAVTELIILYCGSQRGILDQVSLALFPLSFLVFTIVYWVTYLNEAKRTREPV